MPASNSPEPLGRLNAVYLRTDDLDRATQFFGELFGAHFSPSSAGSAEQRMVSECRAVPERIDLVLTSAPGAADARLCFACADDERARQAPQDLAGASTGEAADDQGLPICTAPAESLPPALGVASGALGVVIAQFPDTDKARAFYERVFGLDFKRIGSGDFWWVLSGPSLGLFPITHDLTNPAVPRAKNGTEITAFFCIDDLEQARARVVELGGRCAERVAFGPYAACICDDGYGMRFGLWCSPG